jgi:hypothetical protein
MLPRYHASKGLMDTTCILCGPFLFSPIYLICHLLCQDPWKTTLLLRAKNELKKKEDDEDDLT